ncbi:serine--tRNA ligase [Aquipuribacter nitratireducens]|uniref:Serine--tRNA ligase n=1 Tax=Aquipuribacter nitratireducens TaxID=650104 RepID=A0ABW0GQA9_9MICO
MIDPKVLREDPDRVRDSQVRRGADPATVDAALAADRARRESVAAFERLRAEQKAFGRTVQAAPKEDKPALVQQAKALSEQVKAAQAAADAAEQALDAAMRAIDNLVLPPVPSGGEDDYAVLSHVGEPRDLVGEGVVDAEGRVPDHLAVAEGLKAIDMRRGAKVSGSRFYFLTGVGARLELALLGLAMDTAVQAGLVPMVTPTLVRPDVMAGTGFLGAHADEVYRLEADDLYLVGTSEVALAGYHADEILDLSDGPLRYAGWSACYRREAGSHGKDTRGIIRVHQFHKVEMFTFCDEADAEAEHERMLALEEGMLQALGLPYRVIDVAAGDLGSSAARKLDCEAWLPSQERWLELTSTSNCTTFQARRLGVRVRGEDGTRPVATLNGTLATTRWLVALLENNQQADGSVLVPEALAARLGTDVLVPV